MNLKAACLTTCLILTLYACGSIEQEVSDIEVARYLLNQQRYEEASVLLNRLLHENPENDYFRLLLASSLAGSVGINTIDSFAVLQGKLFDKPLVDGFEKDTISKIQSSTTNISLFSIQEQKDEEGENPERVIHAFENEMLQLLSMGKDALEIAFKLQHVKAEARPKLVTSINLLMEIKSNSSVYVVGQLYLAILDMVQFLNYFRDALPHAPISRKRDWYHTLFCNLNLGLFLDNLSESTRYLSHTFLSLNNARRYSENPVYKNLEVVKDRLTKMNNIYLQYKDLFNFTDLAHSLSKHVYCK